MNLKGNPQQQIRKIISYKNRLKIIASFKDFKYAYFSYIKENAFMSLEKNQIKEYWIGKDGCYEHYVVNYYMFKKPICSRSIRRYNTVLYNNKALTLQNSKKHKLYYPLKLKGRIQI